MIRVFDMHFYFHFCLIFTIVLLGRQSSYYYPYFTNKRGQAMKSTLEEEKKSGILDHIDLALNPGSNNV